MPRLRTLAKRETVSLRAHSHRMPALRGLRMRIAHALITCLVVAAWTTSARGQPAAGYAPAAAGYPAGPGWGQMAGYPMQGGGYPMQAGMQQGYGMPMMQPGSYAGAAYMQPGGMQPGAAQSGEYDMAPSGQPYAVQNGAGEWVEGQSQSGTTLDSQPDFEQQLQFEPSEAPVPVPPPPRVFTWNPPPTGSSILRAMGPPYAALRESDGCDSGLLGDWAQIIRSRVGQVYVRAEAVMLRRGNPGGNTPLFVTNLQLPNQATVIATNNLAFTNEVGQRMTIGVATSQRSAFEVTYLALQNWVAQPSATGPANLFLAGDLASTATAFSQASFVQAVDATMLTSLEFNYLATTIFERFTFLGGFRYFDVKDSLDLNFEFAHDQWLARQWQWHLGDAHLEPVVRRTDWRRVPAKLRPIHRRALEQGRRVWKLRDTKPNPDRQRPGSARRNRGP